MPQSSPPTNVAAQPQLPQQQDQNLLTTPDHRNALTPIPGAVNPLYNVSNEFMRVAGYSQQFKRLLSKRDSTAKKGSMDLPGVTFAMDVKDKDVEKGGLVLPVPSLPGHELKNEQAALAAAGIALGGVVVSPHGGIGGGVDGIKDLAIDPKGLDPKRATRKSAYGRLWKEQPNMKHRLKKRKQLYSQRTKVSDFALLFAVSGIVLTILEAELTASTIVAKVRSICVLFYTLEKSFHPLGSVPN